MKALVGVDVKSKDILPQDTTNPGFDNIASGLVFLDIRRTVCSRRR